MYHLSTYMIGKGIFLAFKCILAHIPLSGSKVMLKFDLTMLLSEDAKTQF